MFFRIGNDLIEVLLQALIGQVDAHLLKAVHIKALEPVYVQHANEHLWCGILPDRLVNARHKPAKMVVIYAILYQASVQ